MSGRVAAGLTFVTVRTYVRAPQEHHAYVTLIDFDSQFYWCEKGTTLLIAYFGPRDIFVRGYAIETRLLVENSERLRKRKRQQGYASSSSRIFTKG